MNVQYAGIKLNEFEERELTNVIAGYARKNHTTHFKVNIKAYSHEGGRQKYVVNLNVTTEFGRFSAEDHAWVMTKAVREAIRKIEKQVSHAMGPRA